MKLHELIAELYALLMPPIPGLIVVEVNGYVGYALGADENRLPEIGQPFYQGVGVDPVIVQALVNEGARMYGETFGFIYIHNANHWTVSTKMIETHAHEYHGRDFAEATILAIKAIGADRVKEV